MNKCDIVNFSKMQNCYMSKRVIHNTATGVKRDFVLNLNIIQSDSIFAVNTCYL